MEPEFDPLHQVVSKEKSKILLEWDLIYALKNYRDNLHLFTVGEIRELLVVLDQFEASVEEFWEES
jgi:hypothetical protein